MLGIPPENEIEMIPLAISSGMRRSSSFEPHLLVATFCTGPGRPMVAIPAICWVYDVFDFLVFFAAMVCFLGRDVEQHRLAGGSRFSLATASHSGPASGRVCPKAVAPLPITDRRRPRPRSHRFSTCGDRPRCPRSRSHRFSTCDDRPRRPRPRSHRFSTCGDRRRRPRPRSHRFSTCDDRPRRPRPRRARHRRRAAGGGSRPQACWCRSRS